MPVTVKQDNHNGPSLALKVKTSKISMGQYQVDRQV